jgi:hypothetical protein
VGGSDSWLTGPNLQMSDFDWIIGAEVALLLAILAFF